MSIAGKLVLMILATLSSLFFLVNLITGQKKYSQLVEAVDKKDVLRELYVVGFQLTDLLKIDFSSHRARDHIQQFAIIYGKKYAEYYYRLLVAKQLSIPLLVFSVALCLSILLDSMALSIFGVLAAAGVGYYYETTITDVEKAREQSIRREFPTVVSTMALLVNAGLIVREAWSKISQKGDGVLHQEMRQAIMNMDSGMAETEAYLEFARRCNVEEVTKFSASLIQNLSKGNRELVYFLQQYAAESWEERKQSVRVLGEEASTKLMIPITIMMLGLLIMLCIPIMSGMAM